MLLRTIELICIVCVWPKNLTVPILIYLKHTNVINKLIPICLDMCIEVSVLHQTKINLELQLGANPTTFEFTATTPVL
jgi:hypothetical protein